MKEKNFIKSIRLKGYKDIVDDLTLEFSIPNTQVGSGLTVIVGPNSVGKSHILEAMGWVLRSSSGVRNDIHEPSFGEISVDFDSGDKSVASIKSLNEVEFNIKDSNSKRFKFLNSEAVRFGLASSEHVNREEPANQYPDIARMSAMPRDQNFLAPILRNKERSLIFHKFLNKFYPGIEVSFSERGPLIEYHLSDSKKTKLNSLGRGFAAICLFSIYFEEIYLNDTTVLIIDEPELYLHPDTQKKLYDELRVLSQKTQCVICTHSPYFFNWEDINNGGTLIRVNNVSDRVVSAKIDNRKSYFSFIHMLSQNWKRPFLLDTVAKEIVFVTKVLLVEGQEDVGLIKKFCRESNFNLNFNVFGYGTDGAGNIGKLLDLSNDLGIKAAALFDAGTRDFNICKEKYPNSLILELPTPDIRDKPEKNLKGMFDKNGTLKEEFSPILKDIVVSFIDFFNQ